MIRRNPTLIELTDNDVQDVRDMLVRKALEKHQAKMADSYGSPEKTSSEAYRKAEEERKKKAGLSRDERLGLR
ncbi:hypothetical protein ABKN59_005449 [Abortiporus biennis]